MPHMPHLRDIRDMVRGSQHVLLRYTKFYHKLQARELALDLLNDASVRDVFKV